MQRTRRMRDGAAFAVVKPSPGGTEHVVATVEGRREADGRVSMTIDGGLQLLVRWLAARDGVRTVQRKSALDERAS